MMSPWFPRWQLGTVVLVAAGSHGLTLVDTGLGLHDYEHPAASVRFFNADLGVALDPAFTVIRQLERMGYSREDVKDIVLTHLHFDHAGGLPDFPHARIHIHRREFEAFSHPRGVSHLAYDRLDAVHGPRWMLYDDPVCDWLGWPAIPLSLDLEMYLVPLFGHTPGHCGVALRSGSGWVFQCGDSLPTNAEFNLVPLWLSRRFIGPHVSRLEDWAAAHPDCRVLAGHMWLPFFEADL